MTRKRELLAALLAAVLLLSGIALAADSKPKDEDDDDSAASTIETLQEQLYTTYKSSKARSLKKAYDALTAQKYAQARKLASPLLKDKTYPDYAQWITAATYRSEATQAYQTQHYAKVPALCQKAIDSELKIQSDTPYSPLMRNVPREIAQAELLEGDARAALHSWMLAENRYERAFQRLMMHSSLGDLRPESIAHYAEACSIQETDVCNAWIRKLSLSFYRHSPENKAITKFFPNAAELARTAHPVGKANASYHAPDLDQAAFDKAMLSYDTTKYDDAIKALEQFRDDFPKSVYRFRARYWLAQAYTRQKMDDKAKKAYDDLVEDTPLTYYGLLAAISAGKNFADGADEDAPDANDSDPNLLPQELIRLRRSQSLLAEKAYELAAMELKDLHPRDTISSEFLMYVAMLDAEAKNYSSCFTILNELVSRTYPGMASPFVLKMIFPLREVELVQKYSLENRLDPILVLSLIKQESAFDTQALSSSGASGLMQLMPATASDTIAEINRSDLIFPEQNIKVGTRYLHKLMTRFNGNIVLSLAAYNAGPLAVERWLRDEPGKLGMLEFIESIPYKETREYVASIIRNYFWYARALNPSAATNLGYFWNVYGPPEMSKPPSSANSLERLFRVGGPRRG